MDDRPATPVAGDPTKPEPEASASPTHSRKRPRVKAAYPRKRAVQACRTCRLRRTKCDNEQPSCSSCLDMGIECTYQTGDPSTFDPASLAILQRLDTLETLLRNKDANVLVLESSGKPSSLSPHSALKDLGSRSLERTEESLPCYINIEAVLAWPVFENQNLQERLDLMSLLQPQNDAAEIPPMSVETNFESRVTAHLLQKFLDNVHIFNPVLEENKVREYMANASFTGLGWDAKSCLLLLIYAIGSISAPYERSSSTTPVNFRHSSECRQAESFFLAAQKRMGMLLCRSGVIEAQCFFLAGVYLMCMLRPIEAWKMFVQALACCQGFHNNRRAVGAQHEERQQLEQSIYWTCFKSELELRLELNVSDKSVWDLTYPAFFPSPPKSLKSQNEAVWFFYLAEIALRRLGNRILNYIYRHASTPPSIIDEAIINFEDQATGWLTSLPPALKLNELGEGTENKALKFILNGHLLDCYEMMYWPIVVDFIHSRPLSPAALAFAKKGLQICVERIRKNESGFYHRHHGTWLMLRSCTRSALVLLAAARVEQRFMPGDWEREVWKVMDMLRHWREESRDVRDRLDIVGTLMSGLVPRLHINKILS